MVEAEDQPSGLEPPYESSPAGALETPSEVALQEGSPLDGVLPWPEDEREWYEAAGSYEPSEPSIPEVAEASGVAASSSEQNVGRAVAAAHSMLEPQRMKQIWEQPVFAAMLGGDLNAWLNLNSLETFRPVPPEESEDEPDVEPVAKKVVNNTAIFARIVASDHALDWKTEREQQRDTALQMWCSLVGRWSRDCVRFEVDDQEALWQSLDDVFATRAPATLAKRGRALTCICDGLEEAGHSFPPGERIFYDLLCQHRSRGAPASRLSGFVEALVFAQHVVGVSSLAEVTSSRRCLGLAKGMRNPGHQAAPLSVQQVLSLHRALKECEDAWDRLMAGSALMAIYARARWSDLQHIDAWEIDYFPDGTPSTVEAKVWTHKSMRAAMHRHQFLPMAAPATGVHREEWVTGWLTARKELGVADPPDAPVMPAPTAAGNPSARPVNTDEAGKWVNALIVAMGLPAPVPLLTSHSFKATCLSWSAKRGLSTSDRLQLGYHADGGRMALVYSRDGAARSIQLLQDLMREIREGVFLPDETRGGRLRMTTMPATSLPEAAMVAAWNVKKEIILVSDDEADDEAFLEGEWASDQSGHITTDSDTSFEEETGTPDVMRSAPVVPEGCTFVRNRKTRLLHVLCEGFTRVFACGRVISAAYEHVPVDERLRRDSTVCRQCGRRAGEALDVSSAR